MKKDLMSKADRKQLRFALAIIGGLIGFAMPVTAGILISIPYGHSSTQEFVLLCGLALIAAICPPSGEFFEKRGYTGLNWMLFGLWIGFLLFIGFMHFYNPDVEMTKTVSITFTVALAVVLVVRKIRKQFSTEVEPPPSYDEVVKQLPERVKRRGAIDSNRTRNYQYTRVG